MNKIQSFVKEDWYVKALQAYLKLTNEQEANISCLQQHIPRALEQLQLSEKRPRFKILSIGAGDGFMDQEILKIVQEGYLNTDKQWQEVEILNTAIEPHPNMVKQYKASIERRTNGEESTQFDLKPMRFEEYAESKHDKNQYDMVHAIHSLYFADSLESTLNHCYYNELGEKGLIACFLADPEFVSHPIDTDTVTIAEKNNWKFERIDCQMSINVTGILRDNSDEGRLLLDFLTFMPNFYQSADQDVIDSVRELLEHRSIKDNEGKLMVQSNTELVLIYKSSIKTI